MNGDEAKAKGWLTPAILGFGLASFLSDAGHEAATSALPLLLVSIGAAPAALGIIEGVADGVASFTKLAGGWLADRPERRRPIAVGGYLLTGLSTGIFGLATSWLHVLAVRTVGWFARGVRGPARDAMMADAVEPRFRGRAFGLHRAMDTAGAAVGPALAALFIGLHQPLRGLFGWTVVPGVLSALAFALLVRPQRATTKAKPLRFWQSLGTLPPTFRRFLVSVFFFGIGDFARTLLILRATQLLTPGMGPAHAAGVAMTLYVGHNIIYALAAYPVGHLADRLAQRGHRLESLLAAGYALGVATALTAALATPSLVVLVFLFLIAGVTLGFEDTLEGTITAAEVGPETRGTAYGSLAAVNGIGDLVSSALVGTLWSLFGPFVAFVTAAALCAIGAAVLATAPRSTAK